jgi:hypothetical protein
MEIIRDPKVGANFVVLLIVKLAGEGQLIASAYTYLPDGTKSRSIVRLIS